MLILSSTIIFWTSIFIEITRSVDHHPRNFSENFSHGPEPFRFFFYDSLLPYDLQHNGDASVRQVLVKSVKLELKNERRQVSTVARSLIEKHSSANGRRDDVRDKFSVTMLAAVRWFDEWGARRAGPWVGPRTIPGVRSKKLARRPSNGHLSLYVGRPSNCSTYRFVHWPSPSPASIDSPVLLLVSSALSVSSLYKFRSSLSALMLVASTTFFLLSPHPCNLQLTSQHHTYMYI